MKTIDQQNPLIKTHAALEKVVYCTTRQHHCKEKRTKIYYCQITKLEALKPNPVFCVLHKTFADFPLTVDIFVEDHFSVPFGSSDKEIRSRVCGESRKHRDWGTFSPCHGDTQPRKYFFRTYVVLGIDLLSDFENLNKMMMDGGAFGGAKAGAAFDPVVFAKKPIVILRSLCLLFSIIVFGCISSQGWRYSKELKRETCLYNDNGGACNYGVGIGVIAFLASIAFLAGEYLFEQMSSVKTRKHYVLADLGFSGFWAFLYFIGFCYLANEWSNTGDLPGIAVGNVKAAIAFSFFSIFTWGGCAYFAFLRFRQGADSAFAPSYEVDSGAMPGATAYSSYPGGADMGQGGYQDPPFGSQQGKGNMDYSSPNY